MAKTDNNPQQPQTQTMDIGSIISNAQLMLQQAGTGAGTKHYIGLPSQATGRTMVDFTTDAGKEEKVLRYQEGSELQPLLDNWDPVKTYNLQQQLVQTGLLDQDFSQGVWDKPSQDAFTQVLALANGAGVEWPDALQRYLNSTPLEIDPKTGQVRRRAPGAGKGRAPLVTKFTNPDDLAAVANDVAMKRLGRTFSEDELNKFVSSYHGTEASSQAAAYSATGGGGSFTDNPSAQTAANLYAEKVDPVASTATNVLPLVDGINKIMKGYLGGTTEPMKG